jgi:hypothetical protein
VIWLMAGARPCRSWPTTSIMICRFFHEFGMSRTRKVPAVAGFGGRASVVSAAITTNRDPDGGSLYLLRRAIG